VAAQRGQQAEGNNRNVLLDQLESAIAATILSMAARSA
jgi:hypothetical protein